MQLWRIHESALDREWLPTFVPVDGVVAHWGCAMASFQVQRLRNRLLQSTFAQLKSSSRCFVHPLVPNESYDPVASVQQSGCGHHFTDRKLWPAHGCKIEMSYAVIHLDEMMRLYEAFKLCITWQSCQVSHVMLRAGHPHRREGAAARGLQHAHR